ncbi:hypothetical protein FRC15_008500, partial [Serendipita sp. 397]
PGMHLRVQSQMQMWVRNAVDPSRLKLGMSIDIELGVTTDVVFGVNLDAKSRAAKEHPMLHPYMHCSAPAFASLDGMK